MTHTQEDAAGSAYEQRHGGDQEDARNRLGTDQIAWLAKFMMAPTLPTLSRGAINDGIDKATGADAARPLIERLIQQAATRRKSSRREKARL